MTFIKLFRSSKPMATYQHQNEIVRTTTTKRNTKLFKIFLCSLLVVINLVAISLQGAPIVAFASDDDGSRQFAEGINSIASDFDNDDGDTINSLWSSINYLDPRGFACDSWFSNHGVLSTMNLRGNNCSTLATLTAFNRLFGMYYINAISFIDPVSGNILQARIPNATPSHIASILEEEVDEFRWGCNPTNEWAGTLLYHNCNVPNVTVEFLQFLASLLPSGPQNATTTPNHLGSPWFGLPTFIDDVPGMPGEIQNSVGQFTALELFGYNLNFTSYAGEWDRIITMTPSQMMMQFSFWHNAATIGTAVWRGAVAGLGNLASNVLSSITSGDILGLLGGIFTFGFIRDATMAAVSTAVLSVINQMDANVFAGQGWRRMGFTPTLYGAREMSPGDIAMQLALSTLEYTSGMMMDGDVRCFDAPPSGAAERERWLEVCQGDMNPDFIHIGPTDRGGVIPRELQPTTGICWQFPPVEPEVIEMQEVESIDPNTGETIIEEVEVEVSPRVYPPPVQVEGVEDIADCNPTEALWHGSPSNHDGPPEGDNVSSVVGTERNEEDTIWFFQVTVTGQEINHLLNQHYTAMYDDGARFNLPTDSICIAMAGSPDWNTSGTTSPECTVPGNSFSNDSTSLYSYLQHQNNRELTWITFADSWLGRHDEQWRVEQDIANRHRLEAAWANINDPDILSEFFSQLSTAPFSPANLFVCQEYNEFSGRWVDMRTPHGGLVMVFNTDDNGNVSRNPDCPSASIENGVNALRPPLGSGAFGTGYHPDNPGGMPEGYDSRFLLQDLSFFSMFFNFIAGFFNLPQMGLNVAMWFTRLANTMLNLAFGPILQTLGLVEITVSLIYGLRDSLFAPLLSLAVAFAALWVFITAIKSGDFKKGLVNIALILLTIIMSFIVLGRPRTVIRALDEVPTMIEVAILSTIYGGINVDGYLCRATSVSGTLVTYDIFGNPRDNVDLFGEDVNINHRDIHRMMMCDVWNVFSFTPWVWGQFGTSYNRLFANGHEPVASATSFNNTNQFLVGDAAVHMGGGVTEHNWALYQISVTTSGSPFTRNPSAINGAINPNFYRLVDLQAGPHHGVEGLQRHDDSTFDAWSGQNDSVRNLVGLLSPIVAIVGFIAVAGYSMTKIVISFISLFMMIMAPLVFLIGVIPGNWGRGTFKKWMGTIVSLMLQRIMLVTLLAIFLRILTLVGLYATEYLHVAFGSLIICIIFLSWKKDFLSMITQSMNSLGTLANAPLNNRALIRKAGSKVIPRSVQQYYHGKKNQLKTGAAVMAGGFVAGGVQGAKGALNGQVYRNSMIKMNTLQKQQGLGKIKRKFAAVSTGVNTARQHDAHVINESNRRVNEKHMNAQLHDEEILAAAAAITRLKNANKWMLDDNGNVTPEAVAANSEMTPEKFQKLFNEQAELFATSNAQLISMPNSDIELPEYDPNSMLDMHRARKNITGNVALQITNANKAEDDITQNVEDFTKLKRSFAKKFGGRNANILPDIAEAQKFFNKSDLLKQDSEAQEELRKFFENYKNSPASQRVQRENARRMSERNECHHCSVNELNIPCKDHKQLKDNHYSAGELASIIESSSRRQNAQLREDRRDSDAIVDRGQLQRGKEARDKRIARGSQLEINAAAQREQEIADRVNAQIREMTSKFDDIRPIGNG